jgi:pyrrolysine biosynthesis protein PylC
VVDSQYDCKRVLAPAGLSSTVSKEFKEIAVTIAEALNLSGIMDVEAILHNDTLKVLEIDARLPSQTPTVVNKSTGINMLELLYDVFVRDATPTMPDATYERGVVYEHVRVSPGILEVLGEHIMADAHPLKRYEDFFGADEALTDFTPGCSSWVATLIITGDSREEAWDKRCQAIKDIRAHFELSLYVDPIPNYNEPLNLRGKEGK